MSVRHIYSCDCNDCDQETSRLHSESLMEGGFSRGWFIVTVTEHGKFSSTLVSERYYCSRQCMVEGLQKEYPPGK